MLPLEKWSGSTIGTVPIGQGIAVTPLQMVSAYATIGNGGVRVTPHLVEKVGSKRVHGTKGTRVVSTPHGRPDDGHVPRRGARGHGHPGGDPRLHGRR